MTTVNHWGKWVDREEPITGVINNNSAQWLCDDIGNTINLDYENWVEENDPDEEEMENYESDNDTLLVGDWIKDSSGAYEPDKTGEYAGIMGESYTQVVWSKYTKRCALCSPCYPGQGDLDSEGEFLAFTLPPELF